MAKKATVINNVGQTFTTESIIKAIAEKSKATDSPISQKDIAASINLLKDVTAEALATGHKVQITGFVTIEPSYRNARKGNNVVTNQPMDIPESIVLNVKAGKVIKDVAKGLDKSIVAALKAEKTKKETKSKK